MRQLAIWVIQSLAERVLRRYHPLVVGVCGSYGKTTTKEAVAAALSSVYRIRKSPRSYNNELGVPYTILGVEPGRSGWRTFLRAVRIGLLLLTSRRPYPTVLVVEFGDDRPGDLAQLLKIVPLNVGVLTSVGPTHLRQFGTVERVFEEESQIVTSLGQRGWAILNSDDNRVRSLGETVMSRIVSYGFGGQSAVRCLDAANAKSENGSWGMAVMIQFQKQQVPVFLPGVTGRQSVYPALAGVAVGIAFGLDLVDVSQGLLTYVPPPGRMRTLPGVKRTTLIDDSYNASPDAVTAALEALREFPAEGKRFALLGEMADLGAATEGAHRGLARHLIDDAIDIFVAVGEKMKDAADEARRLGMTEERIFTFDDPVSAARFIQDRLSPGDAVLIKGSQVSRMEKATRELMAEPERAHELLVRQDRKWLAA